MDKRFTSHSTSYLHVLVALIAVGVGAVLAFFANSAPARTDQTRTNPYVRHGRFSGRSVAPHIPRPLTGPNPVVVRITPVRGPDRAYQPGANIADLDHGFVAGATRYLHNDGVIYNDTRACFLWSEDGHTTLFEPSHALDTARSIYFAQQIAPDGSKVVGSAAFLDALATAPWLGERDIGLKYLPLKPDLQGNAVAISNNGRVAAGTLLGGGFNPPPSQATMWIDGVLQTLPSNQLWSEVGGVLEPIVPPHPHPMSGDGSIIVGAAGPASDQLQATKWVNGVEQQLSTGNLQPQSSVAWFVTDQGIVFGTATLTDGRVLMIRWDSDGTPQILEPPNGLSIITINGIDRSGSAAGGALAMSTSCIVFPDPACNQSPFVWTSTGGFTILPENGEENFYDLSTVTAVSNDGTVAVGALTASVHQEGDPLDVGFVWTAATGLTLINDIIGLPKPDYWSTDQVSSDGNRVMVTGNRPRDDEHDTFELILDLAWPNATPTPTPSPTPSSTPTPTGTPCPEPWHFVASMALDVYGAASTSDGTYVYEAGGYSSSSGTTSNGFNRYDRITDTWMALPDMPTAAFMSSAVYYPANNRIYVFGGEDLNSGVNYNVTRIYDIASQTWSTGTNMPDVRSFMASGYSAATGKIYLIGGYNTGDVTSAQPSTWEYDPVTDTFLERAPIPHAVGGAFSGVVNNHLYVAGGRDAKGTVVNLVWDYDVLTDTWTAKAQMPALQNNVGGSAIALERLWVFGGGNPFGPAHESSKTIANPKSHGPSVAPHVARHDRTSEVPDLTTASYVYDPVADSWSDAPSLNELRSFASGTSIGTAVLAIGGFNGFGSTTSVEVLNACVQTAACPSRTTIFSENFDGVTPPNLPAGWTATNAIDPDSILWVTSDSGDPFPPADSAPNAVFVNDPEAVSDKRLESPPIAVQDNSSQLSFRHNFDFESGFDGGVLEISIGGGGFQDILDAGGSFLTGGYSHVVSSGFESPLAGRRAWSGYSGGFISTTLNLPVTAGGQNIVLRWRMATDNSNPGTGWRVDTVKITECSATPTPSSTPTPTPTVSATASSTPIPTATPRLTPTPRIRPTPIPRPTP